MTVIAALKQGNQMILGGDRGASDASSKFILSRPKVWATGKYLMGYCGTLEGEHMQSKFVPPAPTASIDTFMQTDFLTALDSFYEKWRIFKDQSEESKGMSLLICVGEYIYEHDPAFMTMTRYESDFLALGSGSQYAMGSLYSTDDMTNGRARIKLAIEASCEYSLTCSLPLDIVSMRIK